MKKSCHVGDMAIFNPNPRNALLDLYVPFAGRKVRVVGPGTCTANHWDHKVVPKARTDTVRTGFLCNDDELTKI